MTIAATITAKQYTGNGVTTQFAFPNKIFAAADLVVTIIDNLGNQYPFVNFANVTLGLTYTVQSVDVDTGAIVVLSGPLTNLWTIDIRSVIPDLQSTSIKNQGSFLPELHEEAFDRATRMIQDLLRLAYIYGIHGPDIEAVPWPALPIASARKGMALMFDAITGLPALGVPNTQTITTGLLAPFLNLGITPAENAALVTVVNPQWPPGWVDRYGTNTIQGTTSMAAAYQAAISQALKPGGAPVRFGSAAYSIDALPSFGAGSTLMRTLDVGGNGSETQVILNAVIGSGALFNFDTLNGVYLHDLVASGNSAHKGDGLHFGNDAATEAIRNRVENVTFFMAGTAIRLKNTNTCVVRNCKSWPDNPQALQVPQTVTLTDISHHLYMTGGFVHNCIIDNFDGLPSTGYAANARGIKCDTTNAFGNIIICGNTGGESGTNNEVGMDLANWTTGNILCSSNENSKIILTNCFQCILTGPNAISIGGGITIQTSSLQNTFIGVQQLNLTVDAGSNYNNFVGCSFTGTVADSALYPGNNYENCTLTNKRVSRCVRMRRQLLAWSASITPDLNVADCFVIRVLPAGLGAAFTINAPAVPVWPFRDGQIMRFTIRNESGGAMGALTWSGLYSAPPWTNPLNGQKRTIEFMYDTDFGEWSYQWGSSVDAPN